MVRRVSILLKTKYWWIFFTLIFGLALLLPIFYLDDIHYATGEGPIWLQQVSEYLTSHGRFLTHIIVRIILQNRWAADILTALIAMFFLSSAALLADPDGKAFPALTPILWALLILFCTMGIWIPMIQLAHFASYRLSFAFIALFLLPYLKFFSSPSFSPPFWVLLLTGFLAGQTHEQAVVLTPLLLMSASFLMLQGEKIPRWYWAGIIAAIAGNLIVMGSPYGRSVEKLIQYGEVLNWNFFGQRLNWLDLGLFRYFYSLAKVLVLWIPWSAAPAIIFGALFFKCFRIRGGLTPELRAPLFLFIAAQAFTAVIMFSPRIENSAISIGMDFLLVSLFSLLNIYGKAAGKTKAWGKKSLPWVYMILLIPLLIQIPAGIAYRKEHWAFVSRLKDAQKSGKKEIAVPSFKKYGIDTPLGPIRFIHPPADLQRMAKYQGYANITVNVDETMPPY